MQNFLREGDYRGKVLLIITASKAVTEQTDVHVLGGLASQANEIPVYPGLHLQSVLNDNTILVCGNLGRAWSWWSWRDAPDDGVCKPKSNSFCLLPGLIGPVSQRPR